MSEERPEDTFRVVDLDNGEVRKGKYPFTYQDIMLSELDWLRETEGLDEVVSGAESDLEVMKRLIGWTAKQWMWGGHGANATPGTEIMALLHQGRGQGRVCGSFNSVLMDALHSFGIIARPLSVGTTEPIRIAKTGEETQAWHAVCDAWCNEHQKWVYLDGNWAFYCEDVEGIPQSVFELQEALLAGKAGDIRMVFCGDYAESTARPLKRHQRFRDLFPHAKRELKLYYNIDVLLANNLHDPNWHPSELGPDGEKLGPARLYYKPDCPGYQPNLLPHHHYEISSDLRDFTWSLYDVEIDIDGCTDRSPMGGPPAIEHEDSRPGCDYSHTTGRLFSDQRVHGNRVSLRMKTFAPFLECFLIRIDGGHWAAFSPSRQDEHDAELDHEWHLHDGLNTLEVRVRNQRGRLGVIRRVRLSNDSVSLAPEVAGKAMTVGAGQGFGSVVYSQRDRAFFAGPCGEEQTVVRLGADQRAIRLTDADGNQVVPGKFCIDQDGRFVAAHGHTVSRFDGEGQHLLSFGGEGEFRNIGGIAVDAHGKIYVSDADTYRLARVQVFDRDGKCVCAFGKYGRGPGEFNLPSEIAVASDGTVYVADSGNHRIQALRPGGEFLHQIGPEVPAYGRLLFPSGLCVAVRGNREVLYVVDTFNHRVLVTELDGTLLGSFGGYSATDEPGKFLQPRSVAAADGTIYVLAPPNLYTFREPAV